MKIWSNSPDSIGDENTRGIDPRPPLRRDIILPDHLATPRINPGNPSRYEVTNQMKEVGTRKPNHQGARQSLLGEKGSGHHHQGQPSPEWHTVRPTRVTRFQRKVRVNQIRSCSQEANRQYLPVRKSLLPLRSTVHSLDQASSDHREKSMGDHVHKLVRMLTRRLYS